MPGGGSLSIETTCSDNRITIRIRDTGTGMNEEVLRRIFDPFFTTKGSEQGLGLGLSVVDGIIKSMNGEIDVSSEPGSGTEFRIKLTLDPSRENNLCE
jgi:signal transduction histidine kinase